MVETVVPLLLFLVFLGLIIVSYYFFGGDTSAQLSEQSQKGILRIRVTCTDIVLTFLTLWACYIFTGISLIPDAFLNMFNSFGSLADILWKILISFPVVILSPLLVYLSFIRVFIVFTFYPDYIEVNDLRYITRVRWKGHTLTIPYTAIGGFYVNRNMLFAILNGVSCKIYSRWPAWNMTYLHAIGRVLNTVAANYGAPIIKTKLETERSGKANGRYILLQFRNRIANDSFKGINRPLSIPSALPGKLIAPGETVPFFLRQDPEKLKGKPPNRALVLTTSKIVDIEHNDIYRFYSYNQVEKVETNQATLIIRLKKLPFFHFIHFDNLSKDCPLEEIMKFIQHQATSTLT